MPRKEPFRLPSVPGQKNVLSDQEPFCGDGTIMPGVQLGLVSLTVQPFLSPG
jgi:hypothetical protein